MSFEIVLLAAGRSTRMRGRDKLLVEIDGELLVRRSARMAIGSKAKATHVVVPKIDTPMTGALQGLNVNTVVAPNARLGMGHSIGAGMAEVSPDCNGIIIALADMPEVGPTDFNALISAFDPTNNIEICRATTTDGEAGLPVLFGRRFFKALSNLKGDVGARRVLETAPEYLVNVATSGHSALIDLDTPENWQNWLNAR